MKIRWLKHSTCFSLAIPTFLIIYGISKTNAVSFGLGMLSSRFTQDIESQKFLNMMSKVPISIFDIAAMYSNVTREVKTQGCTGTCKTPIALWVVHSLSPCHDITKEDCPLGLVCCQYHLEPLLVAENSLQRSDLRTDTNTNLHESDEEWDESKFDAFSFKQDPIPGDE